MIPNSSRRKRDRQRYATDPEFRRKRVEYSRQYRAAHKSEMAELRRRRYPRDREQRRLRKYGLSDNAYDAMFVQQHGICPICKEKFDALCVDHCHPTNKVRGLLCPKCNRGLGHYNDDPIRTRAATVYLEQSCGIGVVNFFTILRCRVGHLKIGQCEVRLQELKGEAVPLHSTPSYELAKGHCGDPT